MVSKQLPKQRWAIKMFEITDVALSSPKNEWLIQGKEISIF